MHGTKNIQLFMNEWSLDCKVAVVTLHVGMTQKQDGGYTQWTRLQRDYLH